MNIACIGDCGIDNYQSDGILRPGGITLNFAVHAKKLFSPEDTIAVITALGNDIGSERVLAAIKQAGLKAAISYYKGIAPVQYIERTVSGEKNFVKYDAGVLSQFELSNEQKEVMKKSDFAILPLYTQIETFFKSAIEIPVKGVKAVDFMDLSDYKKDTAIVSDYLEYFDIGFFGLDQSDKELLSKLQVLSEKKKKLFIVTLGGDGSMAFQNGEKIYQPTTSIKDVVDTTGAGDAFAAAFTHSYLTTHDLSHSLFVGNEYAKRVITHIGSF